MSILATAADPLFARPAPERPAYATGILLDAQDFSDEQTYHRGRLARALAFIAGGGTLAGLAASHRPASATATATEEVQVAPGLAVDRLGRLIELPRPACRGLDDWFADVAAMDGGDLLRTSRYDDLARFLSPRFLNPPAPETPPVLPARAVVADVFVRFALCPVGLTPSFAAGPFDALNAVSTSRVRDAYELQLVARPALTDTQTGLPRASDAERVFAETTSSAEARRNALQDEVLAAYSAAYGSSGAALPPGPEHPSGIDPSAVFVARLLLPVDASLVPQRTAETPLVDNYARRFLPALNLLAAAALR
jgi:hypothetical protein